MSRSRPTLFATILVTVACAGGARPALAQTVGDPSREDTDEISLAAKITLGAFGALAVGYGVYLVTMPTAGFWDEQLDFGDPLAITAGIAAAVAHGVIMPLLEDDRFLAAGVGLGPAIILGMVAGVLWSMSVDPHRDRGFWRPLGWTIVAGALIGYTVAALLPE